MGLEDINGMVTVMWIGEQNNQVYKEWDKNLSREELLIYIKAHGGQEKMGGGEEEKSHT